MDDDDEERSRSIPSRTGIGKRSSIIEKFPALGQPLVLFGGLITVPFWEYRCLSKAYLDIMMSDLPRVDYKTGDKEKFTDEENKVADEASRKLQEQVKNGGLSSIKGLNINLNNQVSARSFVNKALNK